MTLAEKLDLALGGYKPGDVISELAFVYRQCGVAITEDQLRENVKTVLMELTVRQRRLVRKVLEILVKRIPEIQRESGQVSSNVIRGVLTSISPVLAGPRYADAVDELIGAISKALPLAGMLPPLEGGEDPELGNPDDIHLYSSLQDAPVLPKTEVFSEPDEEDNPEMADPMAANRDVSSEREKMFKKGIKSRQMPDVTFAAPVGRERKQPSIFKRAREMENAETIDVARRKGEQRKREGEI